MSRTFGNSAVYVGKKLKALEEEVESVSNYEN